MSWPARQVGRVRQQLEIYSKGSPLFGGCCSANLVLLLACGTQGALLYSKVKADEAAEAKRRQQALEEGAGGQPNEERED